MGYLKPKFIKKKNPQPKTTTEKPRLEKAGITTTLKLIANDVDSWCLSENEQLITAGWVFFLAGIVLQVLWLFRKPIGDIISNSL